MNRSPLRARGRAARVLSAVTAAALVASVAAFGATPAAAVESPLPGSLAGSVSHGELPAAGIPVELYAPGASEPASIATTDDAGEFAFDSLAAGEYELAFVDGDAREWWEHAVERADATPVAVADGESVSLLVDLAPVATPGTATEPGAEPADPPSRAEPGDATAGAAEDPAAEVGATEEPVSDEAVPDEPASDEPASDRDALDPAGPEDEAAAVAPPRTRAAAAAALASVTITVRSTIYQYDDPRPGITVVAADSSGLEAARGTTGPDGTVILQLPPDFGYSFAAHDPAGAYLDAALGDGGLYWVSSTSANAYSISMRSVASTIPAITGIVKDAAGNPVAGLGMLAQSRDYFSGSSRTDSSGRYTITGLEPGSYTLRFLPADGSGFAPGWWTSPGATGRSSRIDYAGTTVQADYAIARAAVITGRVTAPAGSAAGFRVAAETRDADIPDGSAVAYVAADGSYRIDGLPAGRYRLVLISKSGEEVAWWGGTAAAGSATSFSIAAGQSVAKDFALPGLGTIRGTLTERSGSTAKPVADLVVRLVTPDRRYTGTATSTDAQGRFEFTGLTPGSYAVWYGDTLSGHSGAWGSASAGDADLVYSTLAAGATLDRSYVFGALGSISGTITTPAGWNDSISVVLHDLTTDDTRWSNAVGGKYSFTGLEAGTYTVEFDAYRLLHQYWGGGVSLDAATPIQLAAGSTRQADVSLSAGSTLTGTISGPAGPIANANVSLRRVGDAEGNDFGYGYADANGNYSTSGLRPGTYTASVAGTGHAESTVSITIGAGTQRRDFVLAKGATIQGDAPAGVRYLVTDVGTHLGYSTSVVGGRYSIPNVPAGHYRIVPRLAPGYTGYVAPIELDVTGTGVYERDFVAVSGAVIGGTVTTNRDGAVEAARDTPVAVYDGAGALVSEVETDDDGAYRFEGLRPGGDYRVQFASRSTGSAIDNVEWWNDVNAKADASTVVAGGAGSQSINALLVRSGEIAGTVTAVRAGTTRNVAATIEVLEADGDVVQTVSAGRGGGFRILGLRPGDYRLRFSKPSSDTAFSWVQPEYWKDAATLAASTKVTVVAGQVTSGIAAVLGDGVAAPITAVSIAGTAAVGSTLTAKPVATSGAALSYQWYANGTAIAGATKSTLTLAAAQAGKAVTVKATAKLGATSASATSAKTLLVAALGKPKITGTAAVGSKLTAAPGTWTSGSTLKYQWSAGGAAIAGATASAFTVTTAQREKALTVTVTATKSGYPTLSATSPATSKVLTWAVPSVSGDLVPGAKVGVSAGAWTAGATLKYQWYANGAAISGATSSSFTVPSSYADKSVTVKVTGSKSGYQSVAKTSAALKVLKAATPKITGTPAVGSKLTAAAGAWTSGATLKYQWYAGGAAIPGATAASFTVTTDQQGLSVTVRVTGSKSGYDTVARTSAATAVVPAVVVSAEPAEPVG